MHVIDVGLVITNIVIAYLLGRVRLNCQVEREELISSTYVLLDPPRVTKMFQTPSFRTLQKEIQDYALQIGTHSPKCQDSQLYPLCKAQFEEYEAEIQIALSSEYSGTGLSRDNMLKQMREEGITDLSYTGQVGLVGLPRSISERSATKQDSAMAGVVFLCPMVTGLPAIGRKIW